MGIEYFTIMAQILLVNIALSADNALAIAWITEDIYGKDRKLILGVTLALNLVLQTSQILFVSAFMSGIVQTYLAALILLTISCEWLVIRRNKDKTFVPAKYGSHVKWQAIKAIAVSSFVLSLDNVFAVASLAKDDLSLMITGIIITSVLMVYGSNAILVVMRRLPYLVYIVAGTLVLTALGMVMAEDPVRSILGTHRYADDAIGLGVTGLCLLLAALYNRSRGRSATAIVQEAENAMQRLENGLD